MDSAPASRRHFCFRSPDDRRKSATRGRCGDKREVSSRVRNVPAAVATVSRPRHESRFVRRGPATGVRAELQELPVAAGTLPEPDSTAPTNELWLCEPAADDRASCRILDPRPPMPGSHLSKLSLQGDGSG